MNRHVAVAWVVIVLCTMEAFAAAPPTVGRDLYGDPLPPGAVARFGTIRWRNMGDVLIVSPDGKTILSAGRGWARAWDAATGTPQAWAEKLPSWIKAARLLADGKTLVTVSVEDSREDRFTPGLRWVVGRWRWGTGEMLGKPVASSSLDAQHVHFARAVLSHDGKVFLTEYDRPSVLWNAETGKKLREVKDGRDGTFTLDDRHVIFGSARGGLYLYETATGKQGRQLAPDQFDGFRVEDLSRDGNLLLANSGYWIYLFDLRTGKYLKREGKATCWSGAISPDGKWAACGSSKAFQLFDTKTLELVREWPHPCSNDASVASFTANGKKLIVRFRHAIRLLDVATGKITPSNVGHFGTVRSLAFSPDGSRLATVADDHAGTTYVWDVATSRQVYSFSGHFWTANAPTFSPDSKTLATGEGRGSPGEADVCLFDLRTGRLLRRFPAHVCSVDRLLFSPDGKRLATAGGDERFRIWDVATGRRLGQVRHLEDVRLFAFVDEGKSLLVKHGVSDQCSLFDLDTLRPGTRFTVPRLRKAIYLPKQQQVVTVGKVVQEEKAFVESSHETAIVWRSLSGKQVRSLTLPISDHESVRLAPDASMLAAGSGTIELWDLGTGKSFATFSVDSGYGASAFSPDGRWFATASDTTVLLWDLEHFRLEHLIREALAGRGDARKLAKSPAWVFARLSARLRELGETERRIAALIADLDHEEFDKREDATRALEKLGGQAAFALKRAATSESLEVRRRVKKLLDTLREDRDAEKVMTPARAEHVIGLLAKADNPAARQALAELAKLPPTTLVGKEARRAVECLRKDDSKR